MLNHYKDIREYNRCHLQKMQERGIETNRLVYINHIKTVKESICDYELKIKSYQENSINDL
jgi:hypothetical protein